MRWIFLLAIGLVYPTVSVAFTNQRLQNTKQLRLISPLYLSGVMSDDEPTNVKESHHKRKNLTWEESYQLLCEYKELHGHCNVPQSQKPLGSFVNRQRIEYARQATAMTPQRKQLLDEIGFVWDIVEHTWNIRYKELCEFRRENGHSVVPRSHGPLGAWTEKQRIEYKKYKALEDGNIISSAKEIPSTTLTKERVQKLNDVDFVYDVVSPACRYSICIISDAK